MMICGHDVHTACCRMLEPQVAQLGVATRFLCVCACGALARALLVARVALQPPAKVLTAVEALSSPPPQAMAPYEGVAVPESEHIEQNAAELEARFRWAPAAFE